MEHFLILVSTVTGCVSIFAFASLVGIPVGVTSCVRGVVVITTAELHSTMSELRL